MTDQQRATMQAALEALDYIADCVDGHLQDRALTAIDAIRAALAQRAQAEPVGIVQALDVTGHPMPNSSGVEWLRPVPLGAKLFIAPPQRKPHSINYFRVQEIAAKRRLNYNDFAAALRDYIGGSDE